MSLSALPAASNDHTPAQPSSSATPAPRKGTQRRRLLASVMAATLAGTGFATEAQAQRAPQQSSIIYDADTGRVLHDFNANARIYPASTTKLMTAYLTFEAIESGRLRRDQRLTVSANAAGQPRTNLGMMNGNRQVVRTITVDDALRGLMVHSGNDAAVVLAEAVGGSVGGFATRMNATARRLGMSNTTFVNPNGLPNTRQVTTARDLVRLMVALERDFPELYAEYMAVRTFSYNGMTWRNTNRLLDSSECPGVTGGKTGYIRASGSNIILSAERNDRRIIVGVFGRSSGAARNTLTCNLINFGYHIIVNAPGATYSSASPYPVVYPPAPARSEPVDPQPPAIVWPTPGSGPVPYLPVPAEPAAQEGSLSLAFSVPATPVAWQRPALWQTDLPAEEARQCTLPRATVSMHWTL